MFVKEQDGLFREQNFLRHVNGVMSPESLNAASTLHTFIPLTVEGSVATHRISVADVSPLTNVSVQYVLIKKLLNAEHVWDLDESPSDDRLVPDNFHPCVYL